jgi:hypothetical protein
MLRASPTFLREEWRNKNRGRLPYMSNTDCGPGRAGGFPVCNEQHTHAPEYNFAKKYLEGSAGLT